MRYLREYLLIDRISQTDLDSLVHVEKCKRISKSCYERTTCFLYSQSLFCILFIYWPHEAKHRVNTQAQANGMEAVD